MPCPPGIAGNPRCLALADTSRTSVCLDVSWATGAPPNMIRCGTELCPVNTACVDWGTAGVHCAPACDTNAACASGCCATVGASASSQRLTVCAPTMGFRCLQGMVAGALCEPPCANGDACVQSPAGNRCASPCSMDGDCAGTCCRDLMGGGRVCAPSESQCGGASLAPACANLDACVTVTYASRGDHCGGSPDSVEVRVRNDCTRAADVEICYERRDGACECGMHRNVAPGATPSPAFWACDLTGNFRLSARAAGDGEGCHPGTCN